MPVKGFRCQLNLTGRIGWKSIEITLYACLVKSVELGGNPLRLHCLLKALDAGQIQPVKLGGQIGWKSIEITLPVKGFRWRSNSTSQIRWLNWVEIH